MVLRGVRAGGGRPRRRLEKGEADQEEHAQLDRPMQCEVHEPHAAVPAALLRVHALEAGPASCTNSAAFWMCCCAMRWWISAGAAVGGSRGEPEAGMAVVAATATAATVATIRRQIRRRGHEVSSL